MRSRSLPRAVLLAVAAFVAAPPAHSQTTPAKPAAAKPASGTPGEYAIFEISPFAGYQWFQIYANERIRPNRLDEGLVWGVRATQDFHKYIGLEESFTMG